MSQQPETLQEPPREIDLQELVRIVWGGRWIIAWFTGISSLVAIVYALLATQIYRAEAILQPRTEALSAGGAGVLPESLGSLAGLAGLTLGTGSDRAVAIATLKSRAVIERFIEANSLLPVLYADEWDSEAKAWKSSDPDDHPTVWEAYNDFTEGVLKISDDKKTGLVVLAIEWESPGAAQQWVAELIARTNTHLRDAAVREGEGNLAYLDEQSRKTGQIELKAALFGLMEAEMKKLMVAKGSQEFALKTVDPAVIPKKRLRPKRKLIAMLAFVLGGVVGTGVTLLRWSWRPTPSA